MISAYHPGGQVPTYFRQKITAGTKIHTMRQNYFLWAERIANINAGGYELHIKSWLGRPYHSKAPTWLVMAPGSPLHVQHVIKKEPDLYLVDGQPVPTEQLAKNDGLTLHEFYHWFNAVPVNKSMALIHFTNFRY